MSSTYWRKVVVGCLIAVAASAELSVADATLDTPVDAGDIVIVNANNRRRPMTEGDSNTIFSVQVPEQASCPGDSANDDWRVQSFVIPAEMDPGALEYGALRPIGENLHALYGADTRPYIQAFLGQNAGPGKPGQILAAPPLSFGVFPAGMLPAGTYRIGVACTYFRDTAKYWDTEIELISDTSVQPGEFRWRLVDSSAAPSAPAADSGSGGAPWLAISALVLTAVVGVIVVRTRSNSRSTLKETVS